MLIDSRQTRAGKRSGFIRHFQPLRRVMTRMRWIPLLIGLSTLALGLPISAGFLPSSSAEPFQFHARAQIQQPPQPDLQHQPPLVPDTGPAPMNPKQKHEILRSNFEQMKKDTDQLLDLARALQKDLDKSNQNVLSLKVVDRAEKIEKLAKKIKSTARGY